jgi:hypothetical protein
MKKGQTKISESNKKALSKDKNANTTQSSISKSQSIKKEKEDKSLKLTSSSKNPSISKSNIQSGYSSISKDKKYKKEKIEEISDIISTGKKLGIKSPDESLNLSKRKNLKSSVKSLKKEDEIKVEDSFKNENKSLGNVPKRGRPKQYIEEEEKENVRF